MVVAEVVAVVVAVDVSVVVVVGLVVKVVVWEVDVTVEVGVDVGVKVAVVVPVTVAVDVAVLVAVVVGVLSSHSAKVPSANEATALFSTATTFSQCLSSRTNPLAVHLSFDLVPGRYPSITRSMAALALHVPDTSRTNVVLSFATHSSAESPSLAVPHPSMALFSPTTCAAHRPGCTDR